MRDTTAAKNLLYRRLRCLADYEAANRALEKARAKNKDVHAVSFQIWIAFTVLNQFVYMCYQAYSCYLS